MTGIDLHESKGTAEAGANEVFVADGAGSGSYQKIPGSALSSGANPFGLALFHAQEVQAPSGGSQNSSAGGQQVVILNTVKTNEISGASLAANIVSLPAGTYFAEADVACAWQPSVNQTGSYKIWLQNTTAGTQLVNGMTARLQPNIISFSGPSSVYVQTSVSLRGRFTLAATSNLQIRGAGTFLSTIAGAGFVPEVFSNLLIWKLS